MVVTINSIKNSVKESLGNGISGFCSVDWLEADFEIMPGEQNGSKHVPGLNDR